MNIWTGIGRLTADPDMRHTDSGKEVCSFTIAVRKRTKSQDPNAPDADFVRCVAWEQRAKYLAQYGVKGARVAVSGRFEMRKYQAQDGSNREVWECICDNVEVIDYQNDNDGGRSAGGSGSGYASAGGGNGYAGRASQQQRSPAPTADEYDPFADE